MGHCSRLGIPEFITGLCVPKFKLSLPPRTLALSAECCFSARRREAVSRGTCGWAEERAPWLGTRPAGGWGVPWARQAAAAPGKVLWWCGGWRPGRERPRCSWAWPRRLQKALERGGGPSGQEGGVPSGRGLSWGWRTEPRWSNGEVREGQHKNPRGAVADPPLRPQPWR